MSQMDAVKESVTVKSRNKFDVGEVDGIFTLSRAPLLSTEKSLRSEETNKSSLLVKKDFICTKIDGMLGLLSSNVKILAEKELNPLMELEKELLQKEANMKWENECLKRNQILPGPPVVNQGKHYDSVHGKIDKIINLLSSNLKIAVEKETKPLSQEIGSLTQEASRLENENQLLKTLASRTG